MIELKTKQNAVVLGSSNDLKVEVFTPTGETLKGSYDKGYTKGNNDGFDRGFDTGSSVGYEDGYISGLQDGYPQGWDAGYADGVTDTEAGFKDELEKAYIDGWNDGDANGYSSGWDSGYQDGRQAEYDEFWDNFQNYGNRTMYQSAFAIAWDDITFNPKYDIKGSGGQYDFSSAFYLTKIKDLKGILERNGVKLDTSMATHLNGLFQQSSITNLPVIDMRSCIDSNRAFYNMSSLETLEIINLREDCAFTSTFGWNTNLINFSITGTIGKDGFAVTNSPKLTVKSLNNIIDCLKDYSTEGGTHTIALGATNLAKLTDAEKAIAIAKGWTLA